MKLLDTQERFEELWFSTTPQRWIVYFTAAWCKPCQALDLTAIAGAAYGHIPIYKCDETVNKYTSGYCGVRSFPTFILFEPNRIVQSLQSNVTDVVINWISQM